MEADVDRLRGEIDVITKQIDEALQEIDRLFKTAENFEHDVATLKTKRNQAISIRDFIEDLSMDLEILDNTDDDLEQIQAEYKNRMVNLEAELEKKAAEKDKLRASIKSYTAQMDKQRDQHNRFRIEKEQHDNQTIHREELIKDSSKVYNIRGYSSGDLEENQITEFMEKFDRLLREHSNNLEQVKREGRDEQQRAFEEQTKIDTQIQSYQQSKATARQEIGRRQDKINILQRELDNLNVDEGQITMLRTRASDAQDRSNRSKHSFSENNWDEKLRNKVAEIRVVEDKLKAETNELSKGTNEAESRTRLRILKKDIEQHHAALKSLDVAHKNQINNIIGSSWTHDSIERDFQRVVDDNHTELEEARNLLARENGELERLDYQMKTCKDNVKKMQRQRDDAQKAIMQSMKSSDANDIWEYTEKLDELEAKFQDSKGDLVTVTQQQVLANRAITMAKKKNCCRLCQRGFADDDSLQSFLGKMQKELEKASEEGLQKEIDELEADIRAYKDVSGDYEAFMRINGMELPQLEKELADLKVKRELVVASVEERDSKYSEKDATKKEIESIKSVVGSYTRYSREVKQYESEARSLESRMSELGETRTVEDIQQALQELSQQASHLKAEREDMLTKKENERQQLSTYEKEYQNLQMDLTRLEHRFEQKSQKAEQLKDERSSLKQRQEDINTADSHVRELQPQKEKIAAKVEDVRKRWEDKEYAAQKQFSSMNEALRKIQDVSKELQAYERRGGDSRLESSENAIEEFQAKMQEDEERIETIAKTVSSVLDEKIQADKRKRTIADNLRLRRNKKDLTEAQKVIMELESKNVEASRDRFKKEASRKQQLHMELNGQRSAKAAEMTALDTQLAQLVEEFETEYKDAHKNFQEGQIRLRTTIAANEDLGKYQGSTLR